jgi:hypothetical protein
VYLTQSVWFLYLWNIVTNILRCSKHLANCTEHIQIRSSSSFEVLSICRTVNKTAMCRQTLVGFSGVRFSDLRFSQLCLRFVSSSPYHLGNQVTFPRFSFTYWRLVYLIIFPLDVWGASEDQRRLFEGLIHRLVDIP